LPFACVGTERMTKGALVARAIWTGSLSFGLVNVPVGLFSATQDHEVHFHQFEKGTSSRIRNLRINEDTRDEVAYGDVVKGAEISDGEYVMLTQEELESVEPGRSRTIDITDFVEAAEIDPIFYQKSYYLAPTDDTAHKAYALLLKAMDKAQRIGVATFVMRGKQYLAAIRPQDNVLILETMYFADEVREAADEIDQLPVKAKAAGKDLDMAVNLIKSLTTPWKPQNYRDTYTERVEQLIDAKKKNREVVVPRETEQDSGKVVDLLAALQASLDNAKGHKPGNTHNVTKLETRKADDSDAGADEGKKSASSKAAKETRTKKTPAKKTSAKKSSAKKSSAKKSSAKKSSAKKSSAKKSSPRKASTKKSGGSTGSKAS
jgi:DNA end-binding protein Ku